MILKIVYLLSKKDSFDHFLIPRPEVSLFLPNKTNVSSSDLIRLLLGLAVGRAYIHVLLSDNKRFPDMRSSSPLAYIISEREHLSKIQWFLPSWHHDYRARGANSGDTFAEKLFRSRATFQSQKFDGKNLSGIFTGRLPNNRNS